MRNVSPPFPVFALLGLAVGLIWAAETFAKSIYLDFGPYPYAGTDGGPAGVAGYWNTITPFTSSPPDQTNGIVSGLQYADGTGSFSLTFDAGRNGANDTGADKEVQWNTANWTDRTRAPSGVLAVADLYDDMIRRGDSGERTYGQRISGFAPGQYDIYVILGESGQTGAIGVGVTTGSIDTGVTVVADLSRQTLGNTSESLTTWVEAGTGAAPYNYIFATVTITSPSDWITYAAQPSGSRQTLAALQITTVPEPSGLSLLGLALLSLVPRRSLGSNLPRLA